jgi:hypothetical protein
VREVRDPPFLVNPPKVLVPKKEQTYEEAVKVTRFPVIILIIEDEAGNLEIQSVHTKGAALRAESWKALIRVSQ